jgi:hypothetical protein
MTAKQLPAVGSRWKMDPGAPWASETVVVTGTGEGPGRWQVRVKGPTHGERWVDLSNFTGPTAKPI